MVLKISFRSCTKTLLVAIFLFLVPQVLAETNCFNIDSSETMRDYSLMIHINSSMVGNDFWSNDGNSTRVKDVNETILPYWFQSFDSDVRTADLWFSKNISIGNETICISYNNSGTESATNGTNTFYYYFFKGNNWNEFIANGGGNDSYAYWSTLKNNVLSRDNFTMGFQAKDNTLYSTFNWWAARYLALTNASSNTPTANYISWASGDGGGSAEELWFPSANNVESYESATLLAGGAGHNTNFYNINIKRYGSLINISESETTGGSPRYSETQITNDPFDNLSNVMIMSQSNGVSEWGSDAEASGLVLNATSATGNSVNTQTNCIFVRKLLSTGKDPIITDFTTLFLVNYNTTGVINDYPTPDDDLQFNITCINNNESRPTLTGYVQLFNGSSPYNETKSLEINNNTLTTLFSLTTDYTNNKENWTGEYWCGDGTANTTHKNDSAVLNYIPIIGGIGLADTGIRIDASCTASDQDNDSLTYYYKFDNLNDSVIKQNWSAEDSYYYSKDDSYDLINVTCGITDGIALTENLTETINVPENTNIDCMIINTSGIYNLEHDITKTNGDCIIITSNNTVINGKGHTLTGSTSYNGIHIDNTELAEYATNITIINISLNSWNNAIDGYYVNNLNITDVLINNSVEAVYDRGGAGLFINNLTTIGGVTYAIYAYNVHDIIISNSTTAEQNYIRLCDNITFINDYINKSSLGIHMKLSTNMTVVNSTFANCGSLCLYFHYCNGAVVNRSSLYAQSGMGSLVIDDTADNWGSCPLLYTWNGTDYSFITDLAPAGVIGLQSVIDSGRKPFSKDFSKMSITPANDSYSIRLVEEYDEIAYLDQLTLYAVNHSADVDVFPSIYLSDFSKVYTVSKNPMTPISCIDDEGRNCLNITKKSDDSYTENPDYGKTRSLMLKFNNSETNNIKLLLRYSITAPRATEFAIRSLETKNEAGEWVRINGTIRPSGFLQTFIANLSNQVINDFELRINMTASVIDYVALDTSLDEEVTINTYNPSYANLRYKGYAERSEDIVPTFYYSSQTSSFNYQKKTGNFTKYGEVTPLLTSSDDKFVIMMHGDELQINFPREDLENTDLFLYTKDYYKRSYSINGSTTDPLPFDAMSNYPYTNEEHYPDDEDHRAYLAEWNTRTYDDLSQEQLSDYTITDSIFNGTMNIYATDNVTMNNIIAYSQINLNNTIVVSITNLLSETTGRSIGLQNVSELSINNSRIITTGTESALFAKGLSSSTINGVNISGEYFNDSNNIVGTIGIELINISSLIINNSLIKNSMLGIYYYAEEEIIHDTILTNSLISNCSIPIAIHSLNEDNKFFDNYFYNNIFNNTFNNFNFTGRLDEANYWNTSYESGTNIVGGYFTGGNYYTTPGVCLGVDCSLGISETLCNNLPSCSWSSTRNGYGDTCFDGDGNGICDTPYDVNTSFSCDANCTSYLTDYLPLSNSPSNLSFTIINLLRPVNLNFTNNDTPLIIVNISVINYSGPPRATCLVSVDGTSYGLFSGYVNNWTNTNMTPTSNIPEGSAPLVSVNCTDSYGNKATSNIADIGIDLTPPIVHARDLFLRSLVPIFDMNFSDTWSPDANCMVTSLTRGRQTITNWTNTEIGTDGTRYEGNVTCTDRAGNSGYDTITLILDQSIPVVNIISPDADAWINNETADIKIRSSDSSSVNTSCLISINGTIYGIDTEVKNNTLTTITTDSIPDDINYSLKVNCSDEAGNVGKSDSQRISIDTNTPGVLKEATFNLSTAYANSSLGCNYSFGDTLSNIININYSWYVNNTLMYNNNLTVNNGSEHITNSFTGYFRRDHNVSCNITGSDKAGNSMTTQNQITISNSAPMAVNVSISPSPAGTSDLTCIYNYVDNDQDSESSVYYQWIVDGVTNSVEGAILGYGNFSINSLVFCTVTVTDGMINSSTTESPSINLSDSTPPQLSNVTIDNSSGYNTDIHDIYANCNDSNSGLMNNYPKITFTTPDGTVQGNFTMTKVFGNQYKYSYGFSTPGLYTNFTFYCRDAQSNLEIINSNLTFLSINSTTQIINYGGGIRIIKNITLQNITLASFCGDGVCDKDENPFRCSQDCRVDFETALTCLWKDPKSCLYTKSWFATLLLLFIIVSTLYFIYRVESNKEQPKWMEKWF